MHSSAAAALYLLDAPTTERYLGPWASEREPGGPLQAMQPGPLIGCAREKNRAGLDCIGRDWVQAVLVLRLSRLWSVAAKGI